jgi:hypothetical protein
MIGLHWPVSHPQNLYSPEHKELDKHRIWEEFARAQKSFPVLSAPPESTTATLLVCKVPGRIHIP